MRTRVTKWGNSLAVRIPKAFAGELGLVSDGEVDLSLDRGTIVLAPVAPCEVTLEELVGRITPANRHAETDTGGPVGGEAW